jgi:hypothetical protein
VILDESVAALLSKAIETCGSWVLWQLQNHLQHTFGRTGLSARLGAMIQRLKPVLYSEMVITECSNKAEFDVGYRHFNTTILRFKY